MNRKQDDENTLFAILFLGESILMSLGIAHYYSLFASGKKSPEIKALDPSEVLIVKKINKCTNVFCLTIKAR